MHSGRWRSPGLHRTRVRPSLAYRLNLLSYLRTTERHSTPQSTLLRHQGGRAWQYCDVSGNLARGTRDLSTAASMRFPMLLGDTAGTTCGRISALGGHHCPHSASILMCVCTTRPPSRTWSMGQEMFHRPLLSATTHNWYIVSNMYSIPSIYPSTF